MKILLTCITIFFARIADVSIGSLRIIFLGKEKSKTAFILSFLEILIWFIAAKDVLISNNYLIVFSYCLGYATGTYIGSLISQYFIRGTLGIQIVTSSHDQKIIDSIRESGYAVSAIDIKGRNKMDSRYMLFMEINKKHFDKVRLLVKKIDPNAFLVVNETKYVQNGYFK